MCEDKAERKTALFRLPSTSKERTRFRSLLIAALLANLIDSQSWVRLFENQLLNANPGLKVTRSINFSSIRMFFTAYVLCSLS